MSVTMNRRTFVSAASAAALVGAMGASAAFATEIDTPAESYDLVGLSVWAVPVCALPSPAARRVSRPRTS